MLVSGSSVSHWIIPDAPNGNIDLQIYHKSGQIIYTTDFLQNVNVAEEGKPRKFQGNLGW